MGDIIGTGIDIMGAAKAARFVKTATRAVSYVTTSHRQQHQRIISNGSKFKWGTYLRGRNGARIFYRTINKGYEILAKANKDNEQTVIKILKEIYE